jgi:hypothetical protein
MVCSNYTKQQRCCIVRDQIAFEMKYNRSSWQNAIDKEMYCILIAFVNLKMIVLRQYDSQYVVFELTMDSTYVVQDGHQIPDEMGSTFATVVSKASVIIALTYATLNGLEVCAGEI